MRVYSPEKTLADVFKYRNKIGMDVALEAARTYRSRGKPRFQDVMKYARVCRIRENHPTLSGGYCMKPLKNVAASVHQRLMNIAKETNRPFNELVQILCSRKMAISSCAVGLSQSICAQGSTDAPGLGNSNTWPTRDIDLLGRISNDLESIRRFAADVSKAAWNDDGIVFDPSSVTVERIAEDADYEGAGEVSGPSGNTRLPIQIDIGFSDFVTPEPVTISYPTILDQPAPAKPASLQSGNCDCRKIPSHGQAGENSIAG